MVERSVDPHPALAKDYPGLYMEMGVTAEVVARRYGVSRQAQDEYAVASQQRTARAQREGFFQEEIAPIRVTMKTQDGTREVTCDRDECNRPDTSLEGLAGLKPAFDPAGSVTPGNASQLSDGASATLLMSRERADASGIPYKLLFRGFTVTGCEPDEMGIGPVFAVPKLLKKHDLPSSAIDLWELNEAFAVQVVYCRDRLGLPMDKLNVNGGSISIGHPFGMTGSRLVGTLANEMGRRKGVRFGIVTMCVGGGQGAAGLFESV
jgi:acetyl-CoA acetyltransferase family protein